jgi:diguanylate cyclase (GGDEF)-like protein
MTLALLLWLGREVLRAMVAREQATRFAQQTSAQLEKGMDALQARNVEISALGEMSRVLQTEMSLAEALEVTGLFSGRLLPGTSGAVYLFRNSADILELASGWGEDRRMAAATMEPQACWDLRRGSPHKCCSPADLRCRHYAACAVEGFHVCLPLMAYGEVLGQMHVWTSDAGSRERADPTATMAQTIAEQVALSLSNAKLRQVLRDQSIKDGLTGMFNRRYMEETLARELARAQRNAQGVALVVVDLDHFKDINDTYGHPVGDAVLRSAAQQLQKAVRASDVACRYGGEEFVLILTDCSKEVALAKAADMCRRVAQLRFKDGAGPAQVTASFGVAAFPEDASEPESLVQAADAALYIAKKTGRNQVVAAGAVPVEVPEPA